jgi:hypothetical protein
MLTSDRPHIAFSCVVIFDFDWLTLADFNIKKSFFKNKSYSRLPSSKPLAGNYRDTGTIKTQSEGLSFPDFTPSLSICHMSV